jgi:hypothetical protein
MKVSVWRYASIVLGIVTALLGMYGAFQFGLKLEGEVSYQIRLINSLRLG